MRARRTILASILVFSLLTAGCLKQVAKTLGELMSVHNELVKKYNEDVNVHVNDDANNLLLSVTYVNSPLNQKSAAERFRRAEDTAQIVKTKYPRIFSIREIWVGFMQQTSKLGIFHYRQILDFYVFDKEAEPLRKPEDSSGVSLEVGVTYLDRENESDIFVTGIQLEGEPGGLGITVLPHLRVSGDVRARKASPPKTVSFDFASYSEKPRFDETTPIAFLADGKPVLQTKGSFNGNDAQFCYLTVPYPAFRRMIAAEELAIKLGDKEYRLTPSQFGAIQKMGEYVKE